MVYKESFKLESRHRAVSFHDITDTVKEICKKSGLKDGIVVVFPVCVPMTICKCSVVGSRAAERISRIHG